MVKKKVTSRKITITLGVLFVILAVSLERMAVFYYPSQAQAQTSQNDRILSLNPQSSIYIGTTLETYYQYVRNNYLTVTNAPMDEVEWQNYPNYYNISINLPLL